MSEDTLQVQLDEMAARLERYEAERLEMIRARGRVEARVVELEREFEVEREAHQHTAHAYEELERESDAIEAERDALRAKLNAAEEATKKAVWILRNDLYAVRVRNALEVLEGALVARPDEAGGSENPADDPAVSLQDVGAGKS